MRLWTLHPCYLDTKGLLALWREALLAQKVLAGATRGYRRHPQLERFLTLDEPLAGIGSYLQAVATEADRRRYRFRRDKINPARATDRIRTTTGQLSYERQQLLDKLAERDPAAYLRCQQATEPLCHPLFEIVPGAVEPWERPRSH